MLCAIIGDRVGHERGCCAAWCPPRCRRAGSPRGKRSPGAKRCREEPEAPTAHEGVCSDKLREAVYEVLLGIEGRARGPAQRAVFSFLAALCGSKSTFARG